MTDSKTYEVAGADVIVTVTTYPLNIEVHITVDLARLDEGLSDHSPHQIVQYVSLPHYRKRDTYWWRKLHRTVRVRTGAQARRVVQHALARIDDAIEDAILRRRSRWQESRDILA